MSAARSLRRLMAAISCSLMAAARRRSGAEVGDGPVEVETLPRQPPVESGYCCRDTRMPSRNRPGVARRPGSIPPAPAGRALFDQTEQLGTPVKCPLGQLEYLVLVSGQWRGDVVIERLFGQFLPIFGGWAETVSSSRCTTSFNGRQR